MNFFIVKNTVKKKENLDFWPLSVENEALLTMQFHPIVVSIFLKPFVKDRGDSSGRLLERRI